MTESFEGKVVLVTGAAQGLGRASALAFAKYGAKVVVDDIDVEYGQKTVQDIEKAGGESIFVKADVSKEADVEALINKAVQTFGRLDCAHNNAAIGDKYPLIEGTEAQWDRMINTNLKSVWLCLKYEIRYMMEHGGGAIVNTSSVAGVIGSAKDGSFYSASKWGMIGLTKSAALEYAEYNIRANTVSPFLMEGTVMYNRMLKERPGYIETARSGAPLGREATASEVAEAVVWLCSDSAAYITGHNLVIDGGFTVK
jgi:NAD(P)-dependent dehydrogenase (short-subunit alcohol dehydrogenase family)